MDLNGFNANNYEDFDSFPVIPAGEYLAAIVQSQEKPTKAGDGASFLELKFQILEGEHEGHPLWTRLNLKNPSREASQIAHRELATICRAVNVLTPTDSSELHDLPLLVTVAVEKRADTGAETNRIKGYHPKTAGKSKVGTPVAAAKADKAPWDQ